MRLRILLFASLRERAGAGEVVLADLPEPLDIAGLKRELERRLPELGGLASVRGVVGTRYVDERTALAEGDEVALLPPVSGGSSGAGGGEDYERGVFELVPGALDPHACQRRVAHPSCGAVVVFTGTTREHNRGRRVVRLEYEAFEAMTAAEMARILERCRAEHGDPHGAQPEQALRMLCQHRTGVVAVGEPAVVVAVASPHRERAFLACRFLIDALKSSLPIWKKEVYPDGDHWVGERS